MSQNTETDHLGDDLLWGVKGPNGIARYLGVPERSAYYLIQKRAIPIRRLGFKTIVASRSELRAFLRGAR